MSHFCVLVIGDDVEGQLAPYDENIVVDRYVEYTRAQLIANGRKEIKDYLKGTYTRYMRDPEKYREDCKPGEDGKPNRHLEYLMYEYPLKWHWTDDQCYDEQAGWHEEEDIGPDGEVYSTYNPKSKWDWNEVGGRWAGAFYLKPNTVGLRKAPNFSWGFKDDENGQKEMAKILREGRVDSAMVKELDWSRMHAAPDKVAEQKRYWDLIVNGAEPLTDSERDDVKWNMYKPEYFLHRYKDAETYALCQANFTAWAYVKDGIWYEKGKMGWWGMSGESDRDAVKWERDFYESVIEPLDPDTKLTMVDCHI